MRKLAGLILVLSIGTVMVLVLRSEPRRTAKIEANDAPPAAGHRQPMNTEGPLREEAGANTESTAVVKSGADDPVFREWIRDEAVNLDSPHVDSAKKQSEIKAVVSSLTPKQARELLNTARDPQSAAREKILSTYLLVEGGDLSRRELVALIASPLADVGPAEAHSEAEAVGIREKSLRIMAIDGLFSRAQNDSSAREALAKVISDIQDPYVRAYAQDRFDKLSRQ